MVLTIEEELSASVVLDRYLFVGTVVAQVLDSRWTIMTSRIRLLRKAGWSDVQVPPCGVLQSILVYNDIPLTE